VPTTRVVSQYQPDGLKIPLTIPKPERARVLLQHCWRGWPIIAKDGWAETYLLNLLG